MSFDKQKKRVVTSFANSYCSLLTLYLDNRLEQDGRVFEKADAKIVFIFLMEKIGVHEHFEQHIAGSPTRLCKHLKSDSSTARQKSEHLNFFLALTIL